MKDIALRRTQDGFEPWDEHAAEQIASYKPGAYCLADVVQLRDPTFHRRAMSLLRFGYSYWEPPQQQLVDGVPIDVVRNFDVYRKEVTILAGYYDLCATFSGEVRLEAKSISFRSMEEGEFREWFKAVKDVLWTQIFSSIAGFTEESYNNTVLEFLRY
jgi:hypothetical protein